MKEHRYQIVVVDAIGCGKGATLQATVRARVDDLGLDSSQVLRFLEPDDLQVLDTNSPKVAVYFGGPGYEAKSINSVIELIEKSVPIIPAVETSNHFRSQVPQQLHRIKAFETGSESTLEGLASLLLEILRLLRSRRKLFISYKRVESQAAATQIYDHLEQQGFQVFLDTHGIRQGEIFQDQLFQQMADSDLVILLNTITVMDSDWVKKEVEQIDAMGISVLQLIWPNVIRDRRTDLFFPEYVDPTDFVSQSSIDASVTFTKPALVRIGSLVESLRARSFAAREKRMLDTLCAFALSQSLEPTIERAQYVDLRSANGTKIVRVVLGLGVPDSVIFHDCEQVIDDPKPESVKLLYDGRNITERWKKHLNWLDTMMVKVNAVELLQLPTWLASVKGNVL